MSWKNIFINFIIKLLKLKEFNAILNIMNWLIKERHYIIYIIINKSIIAENIIRMLYKNMWRIHDLFNIIMLDGDSQFMSMIWLYLCETLSIIAKLFTAFYSQINK